MAISTSKKKNKKKKKLSSNQCTCRIFGLCNVCIIC